MLNSSPDLSATEASKASDTKFRYRCSFGRNLGCFKIVVSIWISWIGHFWDACWLKRQRFSWKMSFTFIFIFMQIKLVFIRKVSHKASFWIRDSQALRFTCEGLGTRCENQAGMAAQRVRKVFIACNLFPGNQPELLKKCTSVEFVHTGGGNFHDVIWSWLGATKKRNIAQGQQACLDARHFLKLSALQHSSIWRASRADRSWSNLFLSNNCYYFKLAIISCPIALAWLPGVGWRY